MKILNMLSDPQAIDFIRDGGVGVIPTDTIYGVVASVSSPSGVERLYSVKHRDDKPGTVIAANIDQLVDMGIPRRYLTAVEQFWPNPISVVIPLGTSHSELHLGKGSLACRIPKHEQLQKFLEQTGPLLTSSANHTGEPPATTLHEAEKYFGEDVDFYVDGGDLSDHLPSTVIRIIDDAVEIIREGAIKVTERGEIINES